MLVSPYRPATAGLLSSALALACNSPSVPGDEIALSEGSGSSSAGSSSSGEGSSSGACDDPCEPGALRCVDELSRAACVDAGGCARWSEPDPCPEGHVCSAGACAAAQGFRGVAAEWPVPSGGRAGEGFYAGSGAPGAVGDDAWRLLDLDGDGALDLVVTAAAYKDGDHFVTRTRGYPQAPFWEIHRGRRGDFGGPPEAWMLPVGVGLLERGLVDLVGTTAELGDHVWALHDLNGDLKPDLVVTGRGDFDDLTLPLGAGDDVPRWDVYYNEGDRFAAEPTPLLLPPGPDALQLCTTEGVTTGEAGLRWSLADLNGDGRSDLVISGRTLASVLVTPGFPDSPHWDVHLGWVQGFQATRLSWALPPGGSLAGGFVAGPAGLADAGAVEGDQVWTHLDLDGDAVRELVVTGTQQAADAGPIVFGDKTPHWRVFRVQGDGFDPNYQEFAVPTGGGALGRGFHSPRGGQDVAGNLDQPYDMQGWELLDLDGDRRLDLAITNEARVQDTTYSRRALGGPDDPRWDVYPGTPTGFLTARPWPTPTGGIAGRGFLWSRGQPDPVPQVDGAVLWEMGDLDGDHKLDLIVTAQAVSRDGGPSWGWRVPGLATDTPHWRVYRQTP